MSIPEIDCTRAHELLRTAPGVVYVDVRTEYEFAQGHPAGALNIPIAMPDRRTGMMVLNPDFLKVAQAVLPREAKILFGCRSGPRSARAVEMLQGSGYVDVWNVAGGFSGARDMDGRAPAPGWAELGLPVGREPEPGKGYEDLRRRAGD